MKKKCVKCKGSFDKFIEQKSYIAVKRRSDDNTHNHSGIPFYLYGVCEKLHYTPHRKTKILWDTCFRCNVGGVTKFKVPSLVKKDQIVSVRMEISELRAQLTALKTDYSSRSSEQMKTPDVVEQVIRAEAEADAEAEPIRVGRLIPELTIRDDEPWPIDIETWHTLIPHDATRLIICTYCVEHIKDRVPIESLRFLYQSVNNTHRYLLRPIDIGEACEKLETWKDTGGVIMSICDYSKTVDTPNVLMEICRKKLY